MVMIERTARVIWQGDLQTGGGQLAVDSEAFSQQAMTFAARSKGEPQHTSPEELIAAAHATCYAMAFSNTLKQDGGAAPERLEVTAVCALDRVDGALKITTMDLNVRGQVAGIDASKFEQLARTADERCPVSNALRGNVEIRLQAQLSRGREAA
jgi:osmotically inducible protein OsmC